MRSALRSGLWPASRARSRRVCGFLCFQPAQTVHAGSATVLLLVGLLNLVWREALRVEVVAWLQHTTENTGQSVATTVGSLLLVGCARRSWRGSCRAQVWAGQTNSVPTPVDRLLSCRRSTIYDDTVQIQIQIRLYLYLDDAGMRTDALTLQHKTVGLLRNNNNNPSRSCDPEVSRAPTLRPT